MAIMLVGCRYGIAAASYPGVFFFVKGILYLIQCCIYRSAPMFASGASWGGRDEKGKPRASSMLHALFSLSLYDDMKVWQQYSLDI